MFFVLLVLLFNFVMHCIISIVVVAFEINVSIYLSKAAHGSNIVDVKRVRDGCLWDGVVMCW